MANRTVIYPSLAITPNNHGGYIFIAAALLMVWSLLFYFIRITIRFGYNTFFAWDDIAASIATAIGFAQSIVIMLATNTAGLGKHMYNLTPNTVEKTGLLVYSGNILFIAAIAVAKIASFELIARLTRLPRHLTACRLFSAITALWGITSILVIGIGCHPSHPWDLRDRCSNLNTSWITIGSVDILIEICLLVLPICLVWPLQMPANSKCVVLFAFGCRVPLISIIVLRMVHLISIKHSSDYTFDLSMAVVYLEVEMHFTLISMTIACLRPFLKAFDTGSLATYAAQIEKGMGAPPNSETIALQSSQRSSFRQSSRRTSSIFRSPRLSFTSAMGKHSAEEKISTQLPAHLEAPEEQPRLDPVSSPAITQIAHGDDGSISDSESSRHIIRKTIGYHVRYSPELTR